MNPNTNKSILLFLAIFFSSHITAQISYPPARKEAFDTTIFGIKMSDPYFWMSRKANEKEMKEFAAKQGELAQKLIDSIPGTDTLEKEIGSYFEATQDEIWNLNIAGEQIYYNREIPKEGIWLCRRKTPDAPEERILSRVSINGQSYSIRKRVFAFNKPLLALMLTQKGETNPQIRIFDLEKKIFLQDSIAPVMFNDSRGVSMAWSPDDGSILYSQAPATEIYAEKYFNGKIRQHRIGTDPSVDPDLFGIGLNPGIRLQSSETPYIYSFRHSPYLIARIRSGSNDNYAFAVHVSKLNGAPTPWKLLKNYVNLGDGFDANGQWLYAATTGADRYRIVKINMETGSDPESFLPEQEDVIAVTDDRHNSGIIAGKESLFILIRKIGDMKIFRVDLKTHMISALPVKGQQSISRLALRGSNDLVFCLSSPLHSDLYQWYDYKKNKINTFPFASKVLDKSGELKTEVIWVPSRDGKKIPVSLVYNSSVQLKNRNPVLIDGYGNSGAATDMILDPNMQPWIKRGGIYAYAYVRGGGELGESWYKDGQFPNKMNSVNDIVDVADWMVKNDISTPEKLLVMGASAGSFLVGNAINQRPDLFAGGIYLAGLPDLATHTDAAGGREEKSIGPKNTKEGFQSNYDMSAIYHVPENMPLPAMLIIHGATDYILSLDPAARYAATLQQKQKGDNPILFLTNWEGGHLSSSNEIFYILKYAFWQTGFPEFQLKKSSE